MSHKTKTINQSSTEEIHIFRTPIYSCGEKAFLLRMKSKNSSKKLWKDTTIWNQSWYDLFCLLHFCVISHSSKNRLRRIWCVLWKYKRNANEQNIIITTTVKATATSTIRAIIIVLLLLLCKVKKIKIESEITAYISYTCAFNTLQKNGAFGFFFVFTFTLNSLNKHEFEP